MAASYVPRYLMMAWSLGVSNITWYPWDGIGLSSQPLAVTAWSQTYDWLVGSTLTTPCLGNRHGLELLFHQGWQALSGYVGCLEELFGRHVHSGESERPQHLDEVSRHDNGQHAGAYRRPLGARRIEAGGVAMKIEGLLGAARQSQETTISVSVSLVSGYEVADGAKVSRHGLLPAGAVSSSDTALPFTLM